EYRGIGSFDPVPTAKVLGQILELQLANTEKPLSEYNEQPDRLIAELRRDLPDTIGRRKSLERIRFKLTMNNQKNTIGRAMVV
ncbi:hypothetical protein ABTM75_19980, partial [Acinetobacter baumannii]